MPLASCNLNSFCNASALLIALCCVETTEEIDCFSCANKLSSPSVGSGIKFSVVSTVVEIVPFKSKCRCNRFFAYVTIAVLDKFAKQAERRVRFFKLQLLCYAE